MTPTFYLLIVSYSCGFTMKWTPPALKPYLCERRIELKEYRDPARAMQEVSKLGPEVLVIPLEADSPIILRRVQWEPTIGDAE